jgi:hypothetical protein
MDESMKVSANEKKEIISALYQDRAYDKKEDIDILIDMIASGQSEEAINMVNEVRRSSKNRPNTKVLEMASNDKGITALMAALLYERDNIINFLVPISNLEAISNDNMSPIGYACLTGNTKYIKLIYKYIKGSRSRDLLFRENNNGNAPMDYILEHMQLKK